MQPMKVLAVLLLAALVSACAQVGGEKPAPDQPVRITVLHTNDHHGRFWKNSQGEYGLAARKTLIDAVRQEVAAQGGHTLLLDGGDVNTGVPESDLQDAIPDFKGMNLIGYDAMAVGNHEFDNPPSVLQMQRKLAKFPMLSANIYAGKERLFDAYKIFNLGGVKVAVMGLTTEDTPRLTHPDHTSDLQFRNPIAEAAQLIPELKSQADVIIAATHMGHYADGKHGSLAPGDVELARAVNGLNLVVGGHSQNAACMAAENVINKAYAPGDPCLPDRQNGTWIVQAYEWGKYVGRADFEYRRGEFKLVRYALIPVNFKRRAVSGSPQDVAPPQTPAIPEDPKMLALLEPHQEFGQQQLLARVGYLEGKFDGDRAVIRSRATNLGVLIGQAMLERVKADFAVVNAGGIRDSLPAGVVTYKDILTVHPFGNSIAVVEMSGAEVMDYLRAAAAFTPGAGGFAHFAGLQIQIASGKLLDVRIGGQPINPVGTYRMAINDFIASGGDGYPSVKGHPGYRNSGFMDAEVLRHYIAAHSPVSTVEFEPALNVVRQ